MAEQERSRAARAAAERALVRVVHCYGETPNFVLLGGLLPQMLCSTATLPHAGTTDIDVQVDLEIASRSTGAKRLEVALRTAGFTPDGATWRWQTTTGAGTKAVVKFELLADQEDQPANQVLRFVDCDDLGAANVRGTGYASRDVEPVTLTADVDGVERAVQIRATALGGFLMAKLHAAKSRSKPRDWYDIAYVLLHNDREVDGAKAVLDAFGPVPQARTALLDLESNFGDDRCQGTVAYVDQLVLDDPDTNPSTAAADAIIAVRNFCQALLNAT